MRKNLLTRCLSGLTAVSVIASSLVFTAVPKAQAAGFDYNNLCSDSAFVNYTTLDQNGIQNFLRSKGSFLANYSHNGRSAAQIIYQASVSNRINPYVVLAMIQKEEGLIVGQHSKSINQTRLDWAIGYGYTDSVIMEKYKGFTSQIENGIWQLKQNYSVWASNGSVWNVGKTMIIDGQTVKFGNRCTSALYRYTPHLGTNFTYYFNLWNTGGGAAAPAGTFDAEYMTQGPRAGAGAPGVNLAPGQRYMIWVNYKNTGSNIWYKAGKNMVRLGTSGPNDRGSVFANGANIRGSLVQTAVTPGNIGTFQMWLTAPKAGGTYTERFMPVAEGVKWMGQEAVWNFTVNGPAGAPAQTVQNNSVKAVEGISISPTSPHGYYAELTAQGPRSGAGSPGYALNRNQTYQIWVNFKNTGGSTWYRTGYNAVHLGMSNPIDRTSVFANNTTRRGSLVQAAVRPGETGTFVMTLTAPKQPGTYVETFRPVAEHIRWIDARADFTFTVK